jgi:hypothetical protein
MSEKIEKTPQATKQPPAASEQKTTQEPTESAETKLARLSPESLRARGMIEAPFSGKGYGLPMGGRSR